VELAAEVRQTCEGLKEEKLEAETLMKAMKVSALCQEKKLA
jgi:hypothetical protein